MPFSSHRGPVFVVAILGGMPRMGRPPSEDPRTVNRAIRLTEDEDELIRAAADRAGMKLAEWCRMRLVAAAKRQR